MTGAGGRVGRALVQRLGLERTVALYHRTPASGGILFDALKECLEDVVPNFDDIRACVILHAQSDPEVVASDPEGTDRLNVDSCIRVLESCRNAGVFPVFASSEAVFGQDGDRPWEETDDPVPCYRYGYQKLRVEEYLSASDTKFLILRIGRVMGDCPEEPAGFESWIKSVYNDCPIRCASDQLVSPVCLSDLADGIVRLIDLGASGLYHVAGERMLSRLELLEMFLEEARQYRIVDSVVVPCSLRDFPTSERRPLNSALSARKLWTILGREPISYRDICRRVAGVFVGMA